MATEYYNGYSRSGKAHRRSFFMWLLDGIMTLVTIGVCVMMLLTLLVPYIHPGHIWFFPALGLIAPATYVATLIMALYWIVRWRWIRAGIAILIVVIGYPNISLFYRQQFKRTYDGPTILERGSFKIMTYNVRWFYDDQGKSSLDSIAAFIERHNPDIICLQECNANLTSNFPAFEQIRTNYSATTGTHPGFDGVMPIICLKKHPILQFGTLLSPENSTWADVKIGEDTVRIFNNHLHTTSIKADDNDFISQYRFLNDSTRDEKIRSIFRRHRDNCELRAQQVDSLVEMMDSYQGKRIICGDFNDTPVSYVYRQMSKGLNDAFQTCGIGYSHTYRGFLNALRIDFIFYSDEFKGCTYEVADVDWSDHHPVIVQLVKNKKK